VSAAVREDSPSNCPVNPSSELLTTYRATDAPSVWLLLSIGLWALGVLVVMTVLYAYGEAEELPHEDADRQ